MTAPTAAHVYQAISAVTAIMAREGIAKARRNEQQGYSFRGIDEVYGALSEHLAANYLCVLPRVLDRSVTERATRNGGVSTYVVLSVEFDLVSSLDGSHHTIRTMGEAMDSADKATNKAMSAAMKYACLMVFQIPTQGDNDADARHPQKAAPRVAPGRPAPAAAASARGPAATSAPAAGDDAWLEWALRYTAEMRDAKSSGELKAVYATAYREAEYRNAPQHIRQSLTKLKDDLKPKFESGERASA